MALPAEAYAQIWDVMRVVQRPSGLQFGGVSRVDSASPAPKRVTYQGQPSVVRDDEHVDQVAAKLRDLINRAPRRIAAKNPDTAVGKFSRTSSVSFRKASLPGCNNLVSNASLYAAKI